MLVACGGSQQPASSTAGPTLASIAGTPDASTVVTPNLIVLGGTDFPTGKTIRIPFQVFQKDGKLLKPDDGTACSISCACFFLTQDSKVHASHMQ